MPLSRDITPKIYCNFLRSNTSHREHRSHWKECGIAGIGRELLLVCSPLSPLNIKSTWKSDLYGRLIQGWEWKWQCFALHWRKEQRHTNRNSIQERRYVRLIDKIMGVVRLQKEAKHPKLKRNHILHVSNLANNNKNVHESQNFLEAKFNLSLP